MGLAAVQHTTERKPLFGETSLTEMFSTTADTGVFAFDKEKQPSLMLVGNERGVLTGNPHENIDDLRNDALNVQGYIEHAEETTVHYGHRERMKSPEEQDADINADNGWRKLYASQDGYNKGKKERDWRIAVQNVMRQQQEEMLRRLEAQAKFLNERIKFIDNVLDSTKGMTNADFNADTAEARAAREKIEAGIKQHKDLKIDDFRDQNGNIDYEAARRELEKRQKQDQTLLFKTENEIRDTKGLPPQEMKAETVGVSQLSRLENLEQQESILTAQIEKTTPKESSVLSDVLFTTDFDATSGIFAAENISPREEFVSSVDLTPTPATVVASVETKPASAADTPKAPEEASALKTTYASVAGALDNVQSYLSGLFSEAASGEQPAKTAVPALLAGNTPGVTAPGGMKV